MNLVDYHLLFGSSSNFPIRRWYSRLALYFKPIKALVCLAVSLFFGFRCFLSLASRIFPDCCIRLIKRRYMLSKLSPFFLFTSTIISPAFHLDIIIISVVLRFVSRGSNRKITRNKTQNYANLQTTIKQLCKLTLISYPTPQTPS